MMRLAFGLVAALALSASAFVQEFQPYPTPKFTVQQWVGYFAGSEEHFDELFRTYLKSHAQMRQDLDKRR